MAHDIIISYSTHDKAAADACCAALEQEKLRCWIAPRDVLPGTEYGASILRAIEACRAMVLVFSANSNRSTYCRKEVERAVGLGKVVIPFRIEDTLPSGAMSFFLSSTHWLDAMTPPLEARIAELARALHRLLSESDEDRPVDSAKGDEPPLAQASGKGNRQLQAAASIQELPPRPSRQSQVLIGLADLLGKCDEFFEDFDGGTTISGSFETVEQGLRRWKGRAIRFLDANFVSDEAAEFAELASTRASGTDAEHLRSSYANHRGYIGSLLVELDGDDSYPIRQSPAPSGKELPAVMSFSFHRSHAPAESLNAQQRVEARFEEFFDLRPELIQAVEESVGVISADRTHEIRRLLVRLEVLLKEPTGPGKTQPEYQSHHARLVGLIRDWDGNEHTAKELIALSERDEQSDEAWEHAMTSYKRVCGSVEGIKNSLRQRGTESVPFICTLFRTMDQSEGHSAVSGGFTYCWFVEKHLVSVLASIRDFRALPFIAEAIANHAEEMNGHNDFGLAVVRAVRAFGVSAEVVDRCFQRLAGTTASEILKELHDRNRS